MAATFFEITSSLSSSVSEEKKTLIQTSLQEASIQLGAELFEEIIKAPFRVKALCSILNTLSVPLLKSKGGETIAALVKALSYTVSIGNYGIFSLVGKCLNGIYERGFLNEKILSLFSKHNAIKPSKTQWSAFETQCWKLNESEIADLFLLRLALLEDHLETAQYFVEGCGVSPTYLTDLVEEINNENKSKVVVEYLLPRLSREKSILFLNALLKKYGGYHPEYGSLLHVVLDHVLQEELSPLEVSSLLQSVYVPFTAAERDIYIGDIFLKLVEKFGFNDVFLKASEKLKEIIPVHPPLSRRILQLILAADTPHISEELKHFAVYCAKSLGDEAIKEVILWLQKWEDISLKLKTELISIPHISQDHLVLGLELPCETERAVLEGRPLPPHSKIPYIDKKNPPTLEKSDPLFSVVESIRTVLSHSHFLDYLDSLEEKLSKACIEKGVNFSSFTTQRTLLLYSDTSSELIPWPIIVFDKTVKTHHLLHQFLLETERAHEINLHPESPPIFWRFVPGGEAGKCIAEGNVFIEANYVGNLLHGKYSHRLQWYVIFKAIEAGKISFPEGYSLKDLFQKLPALWNPLLDLHTRGFNAPLFINSYFLLSPEARTRFPYLSGYFKKVHSHAFHRVCSVNPSLTLEKLTLTYAQKENAFFSLPGGPKKPEEVYPGKIHSFFFESESSCIFYKKRSHELDEPSNKHASPSSSNSQ